MFVNSLLDVLSERGCLSAQDLEQAKAYCARQGGELFSVLLGQGAFSEDDLLSAQSEYFELPRLQQWLELNELTSVETAGDLLGMEPDWWERQAAFPLGYVGGIYWLAVKNVEDDFVGAAVRARCSGSAKLVLVGGHELRQLQGLLDIENRADDEVSLADLAVGAPVVHFVNDIIQRAMDANASDIHFESYRGIFRVRVRVDGVLVEIDRPGLGMQAAIISRIKLMANLDISEKRLPQDGSIRTRVSGKDLDIRVATTPGVAGENIVLRLLDKDEGVGGLDSLGMLSDHLKLTKDILSLTSGIVLVTGPTGSGKTTTLYTFLEHLAADGIKIITVEDPVEYQSTGITQIQVQPEIGLDFASVLRSVLRQDPDIILIGEIRDRETAEIAVQAALTGHLVLTTLHTNDAPSSFVRLMDMGVENYLLASSVVGVLAQRLVRKNCSCCGVADPLGTSNADLLGYDLAELEELTDANFIQGEGCEECLGSGFKGRMAIFEMFAVDDEIRHAVSTSPATLGALLEGKGMRGLREDGVLRASQGATTVSEVLRVTG